MNYSFNNLLCPTLLTSQWRYNNKQDKAFAIREFTYLEIEDIRFFKWSSKPIAFKTEKVLVPLMIWI